MFNSMKKPAIAIAALALSFSAHAQSLDDGIKMYKYERYQSAEKILTPLAASNAMANYYLGLSELGLGDINGAKATFAKFPDDAANMSGQAWVAFDQNNPTLGMQIVAQVAAKGKKKDWQPLQYAADAITYTNGGNYQQAVDWYKTALQYTDDANVHISMGDAQLKLPGGSGGGPAMDNYQHVAEKDAKNSLVFSRMGALWYAARNYNSAIDNYNKAKEADPTNPLPYRDLALAYERAGNYDLAYQNIQQYMQLSDKSEQDQQQYSDILYLSKHYVENITQAKQLISSGAKNPALYGSLAFSQYQTHDSVDALNNARIYFSKQDPSKITPMDYLTFGQIYGVMGKQDSAEMEYNIALQKDTAKDKSDIYRQIAEGFKDAKDYKRSADWYGKLITANPNTQAVDYFWWGAMYYYSQDYKNAATAFEQMETKYPDQPSATYWRGRVGAALDPEGKEGTGAPFFVKWLAAVGDNYDKKSDLKLAYEYLVLVNYNKKDKANEELYKGKLRALDPSDNLLQQIEANEKAPTPKKTTKK